MTNAEIIAGLNPPAAELAEVFTLTYPEAVLTSGRRTLEDQAHDDALDIIKSGNSQWMRSVYVSSPALDVVQAAIDDVTVPLVIGPVELAILGALRGLAPADLRNLSWHLSGEAFDVQPTDDPAMEQCIAALVAAHLSAGGQGKFLNHEGGLRILHVQVA